MDGEIVLAVEHIRDWARHNGTYPWITLETERALAGLAIVRDALEVLSRTLQEHWLFSVTCDHTTQCDQAICACSRVDLGWHPSVGAAVKSWSDHVIAELTARPAPGQQVRP